MSPALRASILRIGWPVVIATAVLFLPLRVLELCL